MVSNEDREADARNFKEARKRGSQKSGKEEAEMEARVTWEMGKKLGLFARGSEEYIIENLCEIEIQNKLVTEDDKEIHENCSQ